MRRILGTMGWADGRLRARRATRRVTSAAQSGARVGASAGRGAGRVIQRLTRASGAGRTGLSSLIELTAAGSVGDAFVAVALAGTLFFGVSVSQARSQVALALLVTMAPFAVLAPLVGPLLDRVQDGRRYILAGTLLARGLLCWGMAGPVRRAGAPEGIRGDPQRGDAEAAAQRDHFGDRQRPHRTGLADRLHPGGPPRQRHRSRRRGRVGRCRVGAPGGHGDLPGGDGPELPGAGPG